MRKRSLWTKGFTMIEMVVVISILAVLLLVLTPVLSSYLERTKEVADLHNVRQAVSEVILASTMQDKEATFSGTNEVMYQPDRNAYQAEVSLKQGQDCWNAFGDCTNLAIAGITYMDQDGHWINEPTVGGTALVWCDENGEVYIDWGGQAADSKSAIGIAKQVLALVQADLSQYLSSGSAQFGDVFNPKKRDCGYTDTMTVYGGKSVNVTVYNRSYDKFEYLSDRFKTTNTASLIYNRETGKISTIVYYDGKNFSSWSINDGAWQDDQY